MRAAARATLYYHTIRHLKAAQVWRRLLFGALRPRPDLRAAPPVRANRGAWQSPASRARSMLGPHLFRFLNRDGELPPGGDWEVPDRPKLWRYNLHYFDDLNADGARGRVGWHRDLIARWVAENPPGLGTGWDPYPTSLRIVNWIKWGWGGNVLDRAAHQSLAVQTRWLSRRLETHLLGNHLLANAKALLFAGCYFDGPEAGSWLARGMEILAREIPEQILADGGHFERSTMYHALALEDILDLINLTSIYPALFHSWEASVSTWPEMAGRMGSWLSAMCHPDGQIAFFNDAAVGIAPDPEMLTDYAANLGIRWVADHADAVVWLEDSGYVRAQRDGAVLFADVAAVGPDYLPAHAHADTLSFELSVKGQRVVVNSGTSCYGVGEDRDRERGTAAHNTVEVDGENSSEVWAGFRVARRARPFDVSVTADENAIRIVGAHDGYRRLRGRVVHRRIWELRAAGLVVVDHLEGRMDSAVARVHFHPGLALISSGTSGVARWDADEVRWRADDCDVEIIPSEWHPEFGLSIPSSALALRFRIDDEVRPCRCSLEWDREGEPCAS